MKIERNLTLLPLDHLALIALKTSARLHDIDIVTGRNSVAERTRNKKDARDIVRQSVCGGLQSRDQNAATFETLRNNSLTSGFPLPLSLPLMEHQDG